MLKTKGRHNISRKEIEKWLESQEVHTTNRLVKHFIKRRQVIVPYIDYMWDVDTASMVAYKEENKGFANFVFIN